MLYRHGDVLIQSVRSLPDSVKKQRAVILAEGEITGHSHRILEPGAATLFAPVPRCSCAWTRPRQPSCTRNMRRSSCHKAFTVSGVSASTLPSESSSFEISAECPASHAANRIGLEMIS